MSGTQSEFFTEERKTVEEVVDDLLPQIPIMQDKELYMKGFDLLADVMKANSEINPATWSVLLLGMGRNIIDTYGHGAW